MTYKLEPIQTTVHIGNTSIDGQEMADRSVSSDFQSYGRGKVSIKYGDLLHFVDANREQLESNPDNTLDICFTSPLVPNLQNVTIKARIE